jgi:cell filamentation protein
VFLQSVYELCKSPIKINRIEILFEIHKHLFQNIYIWPGKERIVGSSKDGKQFFPTSHFNKAF